MHLDWRIGSVHRVLKVQDAIQVPATGGLPYQYRVLPDRFESETWVEAIDIRSQIPDCLQHCNLAIVPGDAYDPACWVANYTPHGVAFDCIVGTALRIPAGARIALQAFYQPDGQPRVDHLEVALRFPRVTVQKEVRVTTFGADDFVIAAGAHAAELRASWTTEVDASFHSVFVHMHARGRDARVFAQSGGSLRQLLRLPCFSFAWQEPYLWPRQAEPVRAGSVIAAVGHFDNSGWNQRNPDPKVDVRMGLRIEDEQFRTSVTWSRTDENLGLLIDSTTGVRRP
jgi:hypothetical protein